MLQYADFRIPVLIFEVLLLQSAPSLQTLTLENCTSTLDLVYPTIRVYDAAEDEANYNNTGTVLLLKPENEKAIAWVGLECEHTKPVRWVFDLNFAESGIGDSHAQTARIVEDFYNPATYTFRADIELQIFSKNLDFVMACITFDSICERRVTRATYNKTQKQYVLRLLPKKEENTTLVTELEKAVNRSQNWGQGVEGQDSKKCNMNFSLADGENSYSYVFSPAGDNPGQDNRAAQDRQLMETMYLFENRLSMHCITDICKKTKQFCQTTPKPENKYWPMVFYIKNDKGSHVAFAYYILSEQFDGSRRKAVNDTLKYAWEGSDKRDFMLIEVSGEEHFIGDTVTVACYSSQFLFSAGTKIGYSLSKNTADKSGPSSITLLTDADENLLLLPEGRNTTVKFILPKVEGSDYEMTVYCLSPVWNSSTEWANISKSFEVFESTISVYGQDKSLSLLHNSTLSTSCNATGRPVPSLIKLIPPENTTIIDIEKLALGNDSIQLVIGISNVDETHAGTYNCVAINSRGETAYHAFEVRIRHGNNKREVSGFSETITIVLTSVFSTIVFTFLIVVIILLVRFRMEKEEFRRLTEEAIQEFYYGADSSVLPPHAAEDPEGHLYANDSVKCLPYDKSFEVGHKNWTFTNTLLGSGAFGLVRRGTVTIGSRKSVIAVKTVKSAENIDDFRATLLELKIMAYIGEHPNIVKLIAASTDEIKSRNVLIGVELCSNGSLHSYLQKRKKLFHNIVKDGKIHFTSEQGDVYINTKDERSDDPQYLNLVVTSDMSTIDLYKWSYQIATGMDFLASKKVLHADLATRNVLLTEDLVVKISDFGLSRELFENSEYTKTTQVALPWKWMAIESLRFLKFSPKSDVWSYGCTLHEMFALGEEPYPGQTWSEEFINLLENGMRLSKPLYCTDNVYSKIMMECWQKEPIERIEFADAKRFFEKAIGLLTSAGRNNDECGEFC